MPKRELPDYYSILQVTPHAESAVIEAAYRQLARLFHPDMNHAPDATARMQAINDAYSVLRDPKRRSEYDTLLANRGRWAARLYDLTEEGEWYSFRLGLASDAFRTIASLEAAIPASARRWDAESQRWYVHTGYAKTLAHVFADFGAPSARSVTPQPPGAVTPAERWNLLGPQLTAAAVCLIALAILLYLAQTPPVAQWRGQAAEVLARFAPGLSVNLTLIFLAALAAAVLGYIAWTLYRPSTPKRD